MRHKDMSHIFYKMKKEIIYKIGRIYILESKNTDKVYIGSTGLKYLSQRLSGHKQKYKLYLNCKWFNYYTSFDIIKEEDVIIRELEYFVNIKKNELEKKESEWIKKTQNCVNKLMNNNTHTYKKKDIKEEEIILCKCGQSIKKLNLLRHEKSQRHIYNIDIHLRKEIDLKKEEDKKKSLIDLKHKKKEYVNNHKNEKKEYDKNYREEKKDIIYQKCICDTCGGKYTPNHKSCHLKTKKHINAQKEK